MKIRYKLLLLFLLIILPLLFIPVFLYNRIDNNIKTTVKITSTDLPIQTSLANVENSLLQMELSTRAFLVTNDPQHADDFNRARAQYNDTIEILTRQLSSSYFSAQRLATVKRKTDDWILLVTTPTFVQAHGSGVSSPSASLKQHLRSEASLMSDIKRELDLMKKEQTLIINRRKAETETLSSTLQRSIMIILSLVFAGFALFLLLVIRVYVNPIKNLIEAARAVTQGDLNKRVYIDSPDEIGELASAFNTMITIVQRSHADLENRVRVRTYELAEKMHEIEHEKSKNEALLANIGEGIIATLVSGSILFINKAARELLKVDSKHITSKKIEDVIPIQDEKGNLIEHDKLPIYKAALTNKRISMTLNTPYYFVRSDKTRFPVALTASPLVFDGKTVGSITIFRDFTKEMQIDRAKDEFVSLASHQLRTPLSIINWYSEMLHTGDAGELNNQQKKYVYEIYHANERMVELVGALLNVSRLDLGTFLMEPQLINLTDISRTALSELTNIIQKKKLTIKENYDWGLPMIMLDRKIALIIFQNLLTNAVKYTPDGGSISIDISYNADPENPSFLIKVTDNGLGIPAEEQPKIFTKLYRAQNVRIRDTEGTGLGLYLVKSVVEKVKGKIWFTSPVNQVTTDKGVESRGTTFFVSLPGNRG